MKVQRPPVPDDLEFPPIRIGMKALFVVLGLMLWQSVQRQRFKVGDEVVYFPQSDAAYFGKVVHLWITDEGYTQLFLSEDRDLCVWVDWRMASLEHVADVKHYDRFKYRFNPTVKA